eukprot:1161696-Pelagomonas_calceolata.AAC.20
MSSASKQQEQQQQGEEVPASSPRGTSSSSRFTSWPDMSSSSNMRPSSRGSQASSSSRLEDSERPSRSSAQSRAGLNFEELQRQAGEEREQQEAADEGRDSRTDHQQQSCSRQEHHQRVDASQDCQEGGFAGWHRGGEQLLRTILPVALLVKKRCVANVSLLINIQGMHFRGRGA